MSNISSRAAHAVAALSLTIASQPAFAHAIAGDRIFPVTLTMDDPGVADEITLPQVTFQPGPGQTDHTQYQWEWDKRITPTTALIYNHGYDWLGSLGQKRTNGFENPVITGKWQVYLSPEHEFIASIGVQRELPPDTHTLTIGGDKHGGTTPTAYFGKGLGDLPIGYLRPFAITGEALYTIPDIPLNATQDNGGNSRTFFGKMSVQYSLPYLRAQVADRDLPEFVNHLVPLVEFSYATPTTRGTGNGGGNPMSLSAAPGVIYLGAEYQVGAEVLVPLNKGAGLNMGYVVQVHVFLDDLLPNSLGRPLFQ